MSIYEPPTTEPCPDCDGEGYLTDPDGEELECEPCEGMGTIDKDDFL